ncbi:MAG: type II toxin-antitoxin system prevent-host-death family antitoxin [Aphanocapsa sp. GSE-SYN-MK-11-07L]|jgi:prevent-host-death family protein|nr:type II toxin-antitoxin system prevent-host-death family antitoxin [Aphanocapsa sp. GSE-SYN-MK-11-07L]
MHTANIHEAKSQLSRLIKMAIAGEEVVISKAGKPIAKLVPYLDQTTPRPLGVWRGKVKIAEDFDQLPSDLTNAFQGEAP